ncbi:MAG: hypothetical protein RI951_974, partial [Pseudomonadota bacterium]
YLVNKNNSIFNAEQIKEFKRKAADANKNLRGDQICVVLKFTDE